MRDHREWPRHDLFNLSVQGFESGDCDFIYAISSAIGWSHRREDWQFLTRTAAGVSVRTAQNEPVGLGLWWCWSAQLATLGGMMVHPRWQGRGIGAEILNRLLSQTGARHVKVNSTQLASSLYAREGFNRFGTICQHQGRIAANSASIIISGSLRSFKAGDLRSIAEIDLRAFGGDRTNILQDLLNDDTVILERDGNIIGYAVDRRFGLGRQIGPVVATCEQDAISLIAFRLKVSSGVMRIDIPGSARLLSAWLRANDLPVIDAVIAMSRPASHSTPESGYKSFALISQAMG